MSLSFQNPALQTQLFTEAFDELRNQLLAQRDANGHWLGELSSSALATATAVSALCVYQLKSSQPMFDKTLTSDLIGKGIRWLVDQQNHDGGWGDTDQSYSNIATTMLTVAALTLSGKQGEYSDRIASANSYIEGQGGIEGLRNRYGIDKTFAVPILANCAIAGIVAWKEVSALPFEAAVVPQSFYRFLQLPVVSYAIPALVAIGQAKFVADPPRNPLTRIVRTLSTGTGLKVLGKMQPSSGGYLEAIPLTSFVVMSLADSGRGDHVVAHSGIRFIVESFRDHGDSGTWPIDTNLATWNTTLAINALCTSKTAPPEGLLTDQLLDWLLSCQCADVHPFTGAQPGGWGWSDLSGSVPDADDTPSALIAIKLWLDHQCCSAEQRKRILQAASAGVNWLLALQNRDRGWPTFCRGWGKLPFDRSGSDITAHVIRSLMCWRELVHDKAIPRAIDSGFAYLENSQRSDGSWLPLWFGNQDQPDETNPVYGTAKVLLAYRDANLYGTLPAQRGLKWILANQNEDGGWGGGPSYSVSTDSVRSQAEGTGDQAEKRSSTDFRTSSLQETALVVEVLATDSEDSTVASAREAGLRWMLAATKQGFSSEKWPIGFYFAKLWYYERLYPLIYATSAMTKIRELFGVESTDGRKTCSVEETKLPHSRSN